MGSNEKSCIVAEQPRVYLPIEGSEQVLPVGRVFCVGRNYAAHAREMGDDPDRDPPFFFAKDASCVLPVGFSTPVNLPYPMATEQFEYEVELVVAIGQGGINLSLAQAKDSILAYAVGLDMTRRDLQAQAKKKGRPWEVGKSFDQSAPMSPLILASQVEYDSLAEREIRLSVNGEIKQQSYLSHLTWSIEEVISRLSQTFELRPGDLIMTGTPENVGPIVVGDTMLASVEGLGDIQLNVIG
ncbi:fumarylacetoacetate hydrolase family protein [Marinomonas epiphytica]